MGLSFGRLLQQNASRNGTRLLTTSANAYPPFGDEERQCVSAHSSCGPLTFDATGEIMIGGARIKVLPQS